MLTIGLVSISNNQSPAAELYFHIVECCSKPKKEGKDGGAGLIKDQDHPPAINVSLLPSNRMEVQSSFDLAKYLGVDFFVVAEELREDRITDIQEKTGLKVFSLNKGESLADLAKRVADYAIDNNRNDSKGAKEHSSFPEPKESKDVDRGLIESINRISKKKGEIIGAITGAGPLAGAAYCKELVSVPFIMISDTTAPDKNDAILGKGRSFVDDYIRDLRLLDPFVGCHTIACNTAHAKIGEFIAAVDKGFLDIRDASLKFLQENYFLKDDSKDKDHSHKKKKIILLGTPATMKQELYNQRLIDNEYEIIKPNADQLDRIYKVIYQIKGNIAKSGGALFDKDDAKKKILSVIKNMRSKVSDGAEIPVLLECIELNVLFTPAELSFSYLLISTTSALAEMAKKYSRTCDKSLLSAKTLKKSEIEVSQGSDISDVGSSDSLFVVGLSPSHSPDLSSVISLTLSPIPRSISDISLTPGPISSRSSGSSLLHDSVSKLSGPKLKLFEENKSGLKRRCLLKPRQRLDNDKII